MPNMEKEDPVDERILRSRPSQQPYQQQRTRFNTQEQARPFVLMQDLALVDLLPYLATSNNAISGNRVSQEEQEVPIRPPVLTRDPSLLPSLQVGRLLLQNHGITWEDMMRQMDRVLLPYFDPPFMLEGASPNDETIQPPQDGPSSSTIGQRSSTAPRTQNVGRRRQMHQMRNQGRQREATPHDSSEGGKEDEVHEEQ